ncbi:MAG: zinc ribbon domain-containing protein [Oscillatoria sp. SIO1A7]|nr:zinc ribbon domain-containing protein [Oscillatoria sp. SIO1A7]
MPTYDYFCPSNNETVEVIHSLDRKVETWGDLCRLLHCDPGETPTDAPVRRLISAPSVMVPTSNTDYKSLGFSKLVKRDEGVYENVTATDGESKIVTPGDRSTYPDFKKKISD